ncbi:MAG TPA: ATP-binding protein [Jatrophihabitantaceae bacterium]|jgi:signal transduction histidine kinase
MRFLTARVRLTVLFGLLFLVAGGALLTIDYLLVHQRLAGHRTGPTTVYVFPTESKKAALANGDVAKNALIDTKDLRLPNGQTLAEYQQSVKREAARVAERQLLEQSGIALGVALVLVAGLGYLMAGRVLRPVHAVSAAARRIRANALHERIPVSGPPDEMRELAETVNDMLVRLDASFAAQRDFIANASHELRTPITTQRALVEVAASEPRPGPALLAATPTMLASLDQQEQLVDGLITLAQADHASGPRVPVPVHEIARDVLDNAAAEAESRAIGVDAQLRPVVVSGDPILLEIMITNLVRNAIRHNVDGGALTLRLADDRLTVSNDGAVYETERVAELVEPFRRGEVDRVTSEGSGLGLAIVASVARAHQADLTLQARPGGGLAVQVRFG